MPSLLLAVALLSPAPGGEWGHLRLRAVDAVTGAGIEAEAMLRDAQGAAAQASVAAEGGAFAAAPGPLELRVSAPGYRPLSARFEVQAGAELPVTFELDPRQAPRALAAAPEEPEGALLHGFVTDAATRRPLAGAAVSVPERGLLAHTDADGYFRLEAGAPPGRPVSLAIEARGYRHRTVDGLLLHPGATLLREALEPGQGGTRRDDTPGALRRLQAGEQRQSAPHPPDELWAASAASAGGLPLPLDPPDSIRVGTSCACTSCGAVTVLSFETYVRRGLNDEWIASWNPHSLRAGAVAYRSYGAYYAAHPISVNYDICSTTCCQVNDADTSTATSAAVDRTAGYMLERAGAAFRAEYSAENNAWDDPADGLPCSNADLSCGNGSAGSPAAGWPCLADLPDSGHGCFGHGRGACQWGTQRWASGQGRRWNWIVDHYYNNNGAGAGLRNSRLSTPLVLNAAAPSRSDVWRGGTFGIGALAVNMAEVAHARVLLGASLDSPATGPLSDPANDPVVTLPPGTSSATRSFTVSPRTPEGLYDLLVSLYDDVDEDGRIVNGVDLPLALLRLPGAVQVCGQSPSGPCSASAAAASAAAPPTRSRR